MTHATDFYTLDDADQAARLTLLAEAAAAHWDGGAGARFGRYRNYPCRRVRHNTEPRNHSWRGHSLEAARALDLAG